MTEIRIIIAGFGGQGIVFLGRLIAFGGMLGTKEVTCFPSYGAEMRGGTANCTVIISDDMIGSPIVRNPDILIVMNEASLRKFQPRIKTDGLLIFDSSLIKHPDVRPDVHVIGVPASEIAASISNGDVKSANMVMLGTLVSATGILKEENATHALEKLTPPKRQKALDVNREAMRRGISYIEDKKSKDN